MGKSSRRESGNETSEQNSGFNPESSFSHVMLPKWCVSVTRLKRSRSGLSAYTLVNTLGTDLAVLEQKTMQIMDIENNVTVVFELEAIKLKFKVKREI